MPKTCMSLLLKRCCVPPCSRHVQMSYIWVVNQQMMLCVMYCDIAALCLDSWPAATFTQIVNSDSYQLCAAYHCIMAQQDLRHNHLTCFAAHVEFYSWYLVYSSMVPGKSQLEMLSTGQTSYRTNRFA